ncbi:MAG TPA: hypothetical protein VH877_20900 [Polyangia bacterium]|nr:hypothetical protein [Polyangia bacterium]
MIHYDKSFVTLHWDETCQAVWAEWKGYAEGDDFRGALDTGLHLLRTKGSSRWLADTRLMGPIRQIDQAWTNEDWLPRMAAAGTRWMALVLPQSSIARLSIKQILNRINGIDMVITNFPDLESARAWLRNPTQTP